MEKRTALRFPADLEAECRTPEASWNSKLCNISTSGCMITCAEGDMPEHELLRIRIKGLAAIDAEVVWQHRNHAGVRFRVPLHPAAMEHLGFVLPEGAWETAFKSARHAPAPSPRRSAARPLNGQLVKRTLQASELGS